MSFIIAMFLAPLVYKFLVKCKLGKQIRKEGAPVFQSLHQKKEGTPTMGGIIICLTVIILSAAIFIIAKIFDGFWEYLNFINRQQTYLPLAAFVLAAAIGLFDDLMGIFRKKGDGMSMGRKLLLYILVAVIGAWWFHYKLEWNDLYIPFVGVFTIGAWHIALFIFIIIAAAFSSNETDGLDGLAGGVLLIGYAALGVVAFVLGRHDLAAFTMVIIGALLAFLWHNIYPAKFFMGDIGSMSLGVTLGVISMLTNTVFLLPFFAFILVLESASVIIQTLSKKILKRKIFISTPIHHHFEAKGWPETQITMRFWIIGMMVAGFGLIIFFIDRFI